VKVELYLNALSPDTADEILALLRRELKRKETQICVVAHGVDAVRLHSECKDLIAQIYTIERHFNTVQPV
jgi:ABC-type phosphate/phosphonate transport system ATPase subunit